MGETGLINLVPVSKCSLSEKDTTDGDEVDEKKTWPEINRVKELWDIDTHVKDQVTFEFGDKKAT